MPSQLTPQFGALLKTLRTAAGLTQEALAEQAGLSVRGLQDLERGQSRRPHRDTVELLSAALGLSGWDRTTFVAAARARPLSTGQPAAPPLPPLFAARALMPLVGRAHELAALDRFLSGESEPLGPAPVLLLAGEPGMGKTRLLQVAAQQAIAQGWCVLSGGCHRRGGQEPYAPVLDALAQHLHAARPAHLRAALAGCAWLVRLLPEFAAALEPLPAGHLAPEQERRLAFAAVARLLANLAGPAGTLLVLDDLQWAGADALDLLATLLRTVTLPLRIVGAYRDTEVRPADPLGLLLADLAQAQLVRRLALGPLAPAEAADLLDDLLVDLAEGDRGQVEGVLRRAGGTPFFLVSYAQALHQGSMEGVPWDLAQGVRQRVALLPAAGQDLLGVAAVVGRHVSRALLEQALVLRRQTGRSWYSPYVLTFRARLSLAEGGWAAATASLREALALAEGSGDLQALRWAATTMAEIDILEGHPEAAATRLVPLLDRPGLQECDVTTLLPVLAWAQLDIGQVNSAADTVDQALARARPEGMRLVLVEALRVQALVAVRRGRWDEAARSLEEGMALARAIPYPYAEARLLHVAGILHAEQGAPEAARAQLEAAQVVQALASLSQNPSLSQKAPPSTPEPQVTEAQWALIAALLPPRSRTGRPRADDRSVLEAILYVQRTGCAWSALPAELGDEATAHRRWKAWQAAGLWAQIAAIAQTPSLSPTDGRPHETGAPPPVEGG